MFFKSNAHRRYYNLSGGGDLPLFTQTFPVRHCRLLYMHIVLLWLYILFHLCYFLFLLTPSGLFVYKSNFQLPDRTILAIFQK